MAGDGAMRTPAFNPPAHLAARAHNHQCPVCETVYRCYGAHEDGSVRPCGSAVCKRKEEATPR